MPEAEVLALKLVLCKRELPKFSGELKRCQDRILVNRKTKFEFRRQKQSSYLMIYFHFGIDLKPSKLKLVLVFSELLITLDTKFYCKQTVEIQ